MDSAALPACPGCKECLTSLPSPTDQEAFVCSSDDCPFYGMVFTTLNLLRLDLLQRGKQSHE